MCSVCSVISVYTHCKSKNNVKELQAKKKTKTIQKLIKISYNLKNDWILKKRVVFIVSIAAFSILLHFAWVVDDAKCIVVTRVYVSMCLSAAVRPHYGTDPDVTWGRGRGCPLVVHYWVDLQSGHGLRCYGNITRTLVTSLRPSRDMTT